MGTEEERRAEQNELGLDVTGTVTYARGTDRTEEQESPAGNKGPTLYCGLTATSWVKVALLLVLAGAIGVAFGVFKLHKKLDDILDWIDENQVPGFFIFVCLYFLATVLFIPGLILSVGAGFVFGLPLGTLAVWVGATVGQTLAFVLGRYLFRDFFYAKTRGFSYWQAIEGAVEEEGWKIVGLLRLAPLVPYNVLNYALGLTSVKFWQYFFASAFGILPGTLLYVYLGSLADSIEEISSGDAVNPTVFIITAAVTGVVIVVVVVMTTIYAKRAINKRLKLNQDEETLPETVEGPNSSKVVGPENV